MCNHQGCGGAVDSTIKHDSCRFKRQLVILAGFDPMIRQRVEYFDAGGPHRAVLKGIFADVVSA
jgi:hypothetical protein